VAGLATSWYRTLEKKGLQIVQVMRIAPPHVQEDVGVGNDAGSGDDLPTQQDLATWAAVHGAAYRVVRDPDGHLPDIQHDLSATTVLVDRHQEIRFAGAPETEDLLQRLQDLLAEQ
jgi:hypothetical protein